MHKKPGDVQKKSPGFLLKICNFKNLIQKRCLTTLLRESRGLFLFCRMGFLLVKMNQHLPIVGKMLDHGTLGTHAVPPENGIGNLTMGFDRLFS